MQPPTGEPQYAVRLVSTQLGAETIIEYRRKQLVKRSSLCLFSRALQIAVALQGLRSQQFAHILICEGQNMLQ